MEKKIHVCVCVILSSTQKYDPWVCFLEPKSNKKQLWSKPLWPGGENPCQPNLVVGVMIYWIECPLKWNQWSYSRATSICWDYGAHGFRSLLYPIRRLRSTVLMWKVWGIASGRIAPNHPSTPPKVAPHFEWVFKTADCGWHTAVAFPEEAVKRNYLSVTIIYSSLKVEACRNLGKGLFPCTQM